MKRRRGHFWWGGAIAILCIIGLAFWQWRNVARFGILAAADAFTQTRISVGGMTLGANRSVFEDVRVTSQRDEPIAAIPRLAVEYDLRELLPGGKRLLGLRAVDAESPHVTIVRRSDGTYNVPIPQLQANRPTARQAIDSGGARSQRLGRRRRFEVGPSERRAAHLRARSQRRRRHFDGRAFAIHGEPAVRRSDGPALSRSPAAATSIRRDGYVNQHWTARRAPDRRRRQFHRGFAVAAIPARNAARRRRALLRFVRRARRLALPSRRPARRCPGRVSPSPAYSKPIDDVRGPVDVYDDGLLTPRLDASLAGVPVTIGGGIYGIGSPRLRMAVRGSARRGGTAHRIYAGRAPADTTVRYASHCWSRARRPSRSRGSRFGRPS